MTRRPVALVALLAVLGVALAASSLREEPEAGSGGAAVVLADAPAEATAWNTQRKLARTADGALHAVVLAAGGDRDAARVVVLRSADEGATWTRLPPFTDEANATLRAALAPAPDGALWLAWTEFLPAEGHHQVFAARWDGASWSERARLSHTSGYSGFPSLAVDDAGRVHVAWYGLDGGTYQVFYRARGDDGAWTHPERLSVGTPDAVNPALALAPDGTVHVAWYKQEKPVWRVYHAARGADGWGAPRDLSGDRSHAKNPSLVVLPNGRALVAWDQPDEAGERRVWLADARAGTPRAVSPAGETAAFPSLALRDGRPLLAWAGDGGVALARPGEAPFARLAGDGARDPSLSADGRLVLYTAPSDGTWAVRLSEVP